MKLWLQRLDSFCLSPLAVKFRDLLNVTNFLLSLSMSISHLQSYTHCILSLVNKFVGPGFQHATLCTFVLYYVNEIFVDLKYLSVCMISDGQQLITETVCSCLPESHWIGKTSFCQHRSILRTFSDGASAPNCMNFVTLCFPQARFWHTSQLGLFC